MGHLKDNYNRKAAVIEKLDRVVGQASADYFYFLLLLCGL